MRYVILFVVALSAFGSESVLKKAAAYVIMRNEGFRSKPYLCVNGHLTVGYGHRLVGDSKREYTREEAKDLLMRDLDDKIALSRRLLPEFDSYPVCVRVAIVDGVFRGDLSGSPKTLRLMRKGMFSEASREYLDHKGYRKSKRKGTGVYKRMDRNARVFMSYGMKLRGEI